MTTDPHAPQVAAGASNPATPWEDDDEPQPTYQALHPSAVLCLGLGVLSILTALSKWLAIIPLAGILLGLLARRDIKKAPLELTGLRVATVGLGLSVGLWVVGILILSSLHASSVPIGYTEVSFPALQPNPLVREIVPPKAVELHEKRVYLTGYMYPGRQSIRIKEFLLVPTVAHCKFCQADLAPTEMVRVQFTGDVMADYTSNLVGVGGKLRVDKSPQFRDAEGFAYTLEADFFQE